MYFVGIDISKYKYDCFITTEAGVHRRSYFKVELTNILDIIFQEFKPFFRNSFSATALFILSNYNSDEVIANMDDYDSIRRVYRSKFSYSKFLNA